MSNRETSGRFAPREAREGSSFDLLAALRRLFDRAERAGDFSGASSVARTIAALGGSTSEEPADAKENLVEHATFEERQQLHEILKAAREWKNRVRVRLGNPDTTSAPVRSAH